ncbi:MAG: hypothetical protein R2818_13355 [Flavobacteriales bacterium]
MKSDLLTVAELEGEDIPAHFVLIALGFMAGFGSHELHPQDEEVIGSPKATSTGSNSAQRARKKTKDNQQYRYTLPRLSARH